MLFAIRKEKITTTYQILRLLRMLFAFVITPDHNMSSLWVL